MRYIAMDKEVAEMATIAIPDWDGRVSPVFDTASKLLVAEVLPGGANSRRTEHLSETLIPQRVSRLRDLGIDVVLCGSISNPLQTMMEGAGIQVIPWLSGPVEDVLNAYLSGSLSSGSFAMPRGRARGRRHRGGRGSW
jgi:predicted Fe-Mo cluster-binding NifX family protein